VPLAVAQQLEFLLEPVRIELEPRKELQRTRENASRDRPALALELGPHLAVEVEEVADHQRRADQRGPEEQLEEPPEQAARRPLGWLAAAP
jgi:hypothetical protein